MFIQYLKTAWRNLTRQRLYSIITIAGLALAMACVIIVIQFVRHEYGYDRFHPNAGRIFRLARQDQEVDGREYGRAVGKSLQAEWLQSRLPEVEKAIRVYDGYKRTVKAGEIELEGRFRFVDPDFADIFSYPVRAGDLKAVLRDPSQVAVTREFAGRLFGSRNPVDQVLRWNGRLDLKIGAVLDDPPHPSYLTFDAIGSTLALPSVPVWTMKDGSYWTEIYVLLKSAAMAASVEPKLMGVLGETWPRGDTVRTKTVSYSLQPLTQLHFSHLFDEPENTGDASSGVFLLIIVGFLLFLAGSNYINLAAARGLKRSKEIGVRKTVGASRRAIFSQFITESLLCAAAGLVLAFFLAWTGLPLFNSLARTSLSLNPVRDPAMVLFLLGLILVVGTAAGAYPAAILSACRPALIFRGLSDRRTKRAGFRKALLVFQFAVSTVLAVLIFVILGQVDFMQASARRLAPAGTIDISVRALRERAPAFKNEVSLIPGVEYVSLGTSTPDQDYEYTHPVLPEGAPDGGETPMNVFWVDADFFKAFPVPFIRGENFPGPEGAGETPAIINRAASRVLGWSDPIGKRLRHQIGDNFENAVVVGVVEDFHMESMRKTIAPMLFCFANFRDSYFRAAVRISSREISKTIAAIESVWKSFSPDRPFNFTFMDDKISKLYEKEIRSGRVIGFAGGLAVVIACLGLFGLSAFVTESRTKEIGIRKTLGASTSRIVVFLSKEFLRLVAVGILAAVPVAFLLARSWLSGFAYRISPGPAVFLPAVLLMLAVSWLSISSQTIKAACEDPVKSLRYE